VGCGYRGSNPCRGATVRINKLQSGHCRTLGKSREHETDGDKRERRHGEPPTPEYTADSLKLVTAGAYAYAGKLPRWCGRVQVAST
jgi:hypothetical protein